MAEASPAIAQPVTAKDPVPPAQALNRPDDRFFGELSRINNELANLQREMARKNADLIAALKGIQASEQRYRTLSACSPFPRPSPITSVRSSRSSPRCAARPSAAV